MFKVTLTKYQCSICEKLYDTQEECQGCESKPVSQDKGVKVGDKVRIIQGQDQGLATVERIWITTKDWGHYLWERYWHTIHLQALCSNGVYSRQLTFDDYEVIDKYK